MRPQKVNCLVERLLATKQQNIDPVSDPAAKCYQYYMGEMTIQQYQRKIRMRQITQQSRAEYKTSGLGGDDSEQESV